jgi:ABC-type multidrug transport system fused ATPase/permease subunit
LDSTAQSQVLKAVLEAFEGKGIIWALHRPSYAKYFDRVVVIRGGRIVEQGRFDDLNKSGTALHDMLQTE